MITISISAGYSWIIAILLILSITANVTRTVYSLMRVREERRGIKHEE